MTWWMKILWATVIVEAVAEITSTSVLFERLRVWIGGPAEGVVTGPDNPPTTLLGIFVRCGYCQSAWVGILISYMMWIAGPLSHLAWAEPLLWGFAAHGLSTVWHDIKRGPRRLWEAVGVTRQHTGTFLVQTQALPYLPVETQPVASEEK